MRRSIRSLMFVSVLSFSAAVPLAAAGPVEDCYDRVLTLCDAALKDSNWAEKIAVGVACTVMIADCTGSVMAS